MKRGVLGWRRRGTLVSMAAVAVAVAALAALALLSCAVNPATGRRQLSLYGEAQESEMGRQADREILASLGLYEDPGLQRYVGRLGKRLAAISERPELPWKFQVVDDPVVNAFALPGGFIYVTRGILAHFQSEAELVAVLGHEIGHVTARHSINQMSKAQLAGLGLGLGSLVSPELSRFTGITEMGLGLLFLKFGRDDERQADALGLRYMAEAGYAPQEMLDVFEMLNRVGKAREGGGSVPGWLSTHPAPEDRSERIRAAISEQGLRPRKGRAARDPYLQRLDGMVYGENPRHGFFRDEIFFHPEMEFELRFPPSWETANQRQLVAAISPEEDGAIQLSVARESSPDAAAEAFFAGTGATRAGPWRSDLHGLKATSARFRALSGSEEVAGLALFVAHEGNVFRLLGYASRDRWPDHRRSIEESLESFERLTDPSILSVEPRRIRLMTLDRAMTLEGFNSSYPSTVPLDTLALVNRAGPRRTLPAGRTLKRVVGGP